jgi:hypothetical protein
MSNYATDLLMRTLFIAGIAAAGWRLFVFSGTTTIERWFTELAIALGIGFVINIFAALFLPESFS